MSDTVRRLFYGPSSPILSVENRSAILVLVKKWPRMYQILQFPNFFKGQDPLPVKNGHYCVIITTTTPQRALFYPHPHPCIHTSLQQRCGSGVTMFLQATTGELLPTFCKGLSTLFPTEKTDLL